MKLSDFKKQLSVTTQLNFVLPDGTVIPNHFHVTEVGQLTKHFIDCGGIVRNETVVNFQLWEANDFDHRLAPQKLSEIIALSEKVLNLQDAEIEVEYQSNTIGKYHLEFNDAKFQLIPTKTNCLASDSCGIPSEKLKVNLAGAQSTSNGTCAPGGKCC